jgi:anti-sigma regulatory factor (Ser/Thr protein kinase)
MPINKQKVRDFIIKEIETHASDIVTLVAKEFGFSRQRAHEYVAREVSKGTLMKVGETRWTRYFLAGSKNIEFSIKIKPGLAEDLVWSKYVKPMLLSYPENIRNICNYSFTEIFNNAIDHSAGTSIFVNVQIDDKNINIIIMDNGIGIFQKIQKALNLESMREAILHLSKGKFTTDPSKHTGEGIFFTSRMCDNFSIMSNGLYYTFTGKDWFLSSEKKEDFGDGTFIKLVVSMNSKKMPKEIFDQFSDQEIGFGKTIVAVVLSADSNDPHISRSQAKRLLMGLDKFRQVVLDFEGVSSVGQAFVDEVFRVFQNEHPDIVIRYVNANTEVDSMIKRGLANK